MPIKEFKIKNLKLRVKNIKAEIKVILHPSFCTLNSTRGFTLIELMIAMVIVGIVFGIVIGASNGIQQQSRDAQRKSDLSKIQTALQQFYADENKYPSREVFSGTSIPGVSDTSKVYLNPIPKDPRGGSYYYLPVLNQGSSTVCSSSDSPGNSCHYYYLCTTLESGSSTDPCFDGVANGNYKLTPF